MTSDGIHTYTYDAEGNITGVEYLYDYAGNRKSTWLLNQPGLPAGFGEEGRNYWNGNQIAHRALDGNTYFEQRDWIGTERLRTSYTGAASFTSEPFGDGFKPTIAINDGSNQDNGQFALLDYDQESGTSHAQYRQYSNTQGRWLRPDPYYGSYDLSNPQSFNRYAYALNIPLSLTDPLGLMTEGPAEYCGDSCSACAYDDNTVYCDPGETSGGPSGGAGGAGGGGAAGPGSAPSNNPNSNLDKIIKTCTDQGNAAAAPYLAQATTGFGFGNFLGGGISGALGAATKGLIGGVVGFVSGYLAKPLGNLLAANFAMTSATSSCLSANGLEASGSYSGK
jgi:RHS repeat-associated protein